MGDKYSYKDWLFSRGGDAFLEEFYSIIDDFYKRKTEDKKMIISIDLTRENDDIFSFSKVCGEKHRLIIGGEEDIQVVITKSQLTAMRDDINKYNTTHGRRHI